MDELRQLTQEELRDKCNAQLAELAKVKLALKSGQLTSENINNARDLKKTIARIKTVLREKRLIKA